MRETDIGQWLQELGLPPPSQVIGSLPAGEQVRMAESLQRRRRFLTRLASLGRYTFRGDEDVLDVGCGLGGSTVALAQCAQRVIGIEATYSPQHGARALRTYIEGYDDPLFDTSRLNLYPNELPWRFADERCAPLVRVLLRLARETHVAGDPLCERIRQWEADERQSPVARAEKPDAFTTL